MILWTLRTNGSGCCWLEIVDPLRPVRLDSFLEDLSSSGQWCCHDKVKLSGEAAVLCLFAEAADCTWPGV